ncbi:hypothetical protein C8R48DRAFT_678310 [Suillus tomentosus]|nr:hypothetical protein C8R48DRAFT_678310 [Suillus tomentosus]
MAPLSFFPSILALVCLRLVLLYRLTIDQILGTVPVPRLPPIAPTDFKDVRLRSHMTRASLISVDSTSPVSVATPDPSGYVTNAPLYYITRGRYIGVFSGWDATGPKVLGVSRAIYHKVESVEQGAGIVRGAIERGEAAQVV